MVSCLAIYYIDDIIFYYIKFSSKSDVYLSFNGSILINDSAIGIRAIRTAEHLRKHVVCTSDRMPCCQGEPQNGEWYFPNGSQVKHKEEEQAVAFHRSRDNLGNVNLLRTNHTVLSPSGKFCCEVEDATGRNQTLCINICNSTCVHITDGVATPTLGQSYSLTCSVNGTGGAMISKYQWNKNGIELNETGHILSFQNLSLSDAGLYTCTITVRSQLVTYNSSIEVVLQCKNRCYINLLALIFCINCSTSPNFGNCQK